MRLTYKPGSVVDDHLSRHVVAHMLKRSYGLLNEQLARVAQSRPPCSRQGLPSFYVTIKSCGLLPHSFHPYLGKPRRYRFCGTFPRVTSGRR